MVLQNSGRYRPPDKKEDAEAGDEGQTDLRLREAHENDEIDSKYGFDRVKSRYIILA